MPKNFNYGQNTNFKLLKHFVRRFNIFINPKIVNKSEAKAIDYEYCLSVGGN